MENSRLRKIIAIVLVILAFLLAALIIANSIIQSFHLADNEHISIISYETYTLPTDQKYTPTSGNSYTIKPDQESIAADSSLPSNNSSLLENSINSSSSSPLSSIAGSEVSKEQVSSSAAHSSSGKNEDISSSASYSSSSKAESKTSSRSEETTQQTESGQQIPVHQHSYSERIIAPNCISRGYTLHTCECGNSYVDNYKEALGHSWSNWETISAATVTSKGLQQRTCSRCSAKDYRYTEKLTINNSPNSDFAEEVIRLINEERKKNGIEPLVIDNTLMDSAYTRSTELKTSFSHKRPNGNQGYTLALELGYSIVGENIAAGQPSPEDVVSAWMGSTGHRSNILNPDFTNTGVGCYISDDGWIYWAQLFGG